MNPYGKDARQTYQNTRVNTASRKDLLFMLLQGGIKFLHLAEESLREDRLEEANEHLIRAQEVVSELRASLDRKRGGEFAERMDALYDFMYRQLVSANVQKDPQPAVRVREMLEDLLSTWQEGLGQEEGETGGGGIDQRA